MSSKQNMTQEIGDIIYETLKASGIKENRGYITDIVSDVLFKEGYCKLAHLKRQLENPYWEDTFQSSGWNACLNQIDLIIRKLQ